MESARRSLRPADTLNSERGTAILEFSAVLPFVLMMIFSVIEISNAVNQYLQVSRIAFEGARYGASLAGLEEGTYNQSMTYQEQVQARMKRLLTDYGFDPGTASVSTALTPPSADSTYRLVTVSIEIPVRPVLFHEYANFRLKSDSWAPHLFISDE